MALADRALELEIEGAAAIVAPLPIDVLAAVLDVPESDVVAAVEALEAEGRIASSRHGVTASETSLSATRLAHLAGRIADELEVRLAPAETVARARWAAGDAGRAHAGFLTALEDETTPAETRFGIVSDAIDAGHEARVPAAALASLLVTRARMRRSRGENEEAMGDLDAATRHLEGEMLVDALGFAAALHDDRQRPADAERTIAMAELVAAGEGLHAKLGSLLTFHGRVLARLGFEAETEQVFTRGLELVDAHGSAVQRYYASLNQAWTDLDRGWVARAESRYGAARMRADSMGDPVAAAEIDIAVARARFSTGDAQGARASLDAARTVADETGAPALEFLITLAEAEGAITFRQTGEALEAAERLRRIVDESFPQWRNRAAAIEARAHLLAQRRGEAREAVARGLEHTPHGANGLRLRTELEALSLMAEERWDEERAADVADRLLQGGWLLAAVGLLTQRCRREKRPELGRAAAGLAHRIGAAPAAAEAIEAAGLWNDAVAGPVVLAIQRVAHTVPEAWRERWRSEPAIAHALEQERSVATVTDVDLLGHLDAVLAEAGLDRSQVVLSPAQRRAAGLVRSGSAILTMGRFLAWVTAAAVVAAIVAVAVRPDTVQVPVASPTTAPTTTIPPLLEREVPIPEDIGGQAAFAGGDSRNAVFDVSVGEPQGIYWRRPVTGFIDTEPVLRGRGVYIGDSRGYVYGLDLISGTVFEHRMDGGVDVAPTVDQVVFGQDDQGKVLVFVADDRGNLLARATNDQEGVIWSVPLESPATGPPLVRPQSLIVATAEGILWDLSPADGTELRRFPADGSIEGGFADPLAAADGFIYARTGDGAVMVIDESTFTEVCTYESPLARATTHPVVGEGRWFIGTSATTVRMFNAGTCVDAGIGTMAITTPVQFAPVVADGILWVVADAVLLPLDIETGQSAFVASAGGTYISPPIVAGDLVLISTEAGELVAISRADGEVAWRVDIGDAVRTRAVVADGLVLVAKARGELIAIAAPTS